MDFREFQHGSTEYADSLRLREEVLRSPLGKSLSAADLAGEDKQLHFGIFDGSQLRACLVMRPVENPGVKLRQMAVSPLYRGQGLGRQLVQAAEQKVAERGHRKIELSARQSAVSFYQKLGYQSAGEAYQEHGIAHVHMHKPL